MHDTAVILVVEDREDDIVLIDKFFQSASILNPLHFVRTGEEAVAYLSAEGKYSNRAEYPLPALVLLDLKMPGMDGFEVLTWIRSQKSLRVIPVIVLTSSNHLSDVNRAYQLGANSFFVKDFDFRNSVALARLIQDYWLTKARLPDSSRPSQKANGHR